MKRLAVRPAARVEGSIRVPGDKSISHRAVLLAAMGAGDCRIEGLAPGDAVRSTIECVRALGVDISRPQSQVENKGEGSLDAHWQLLVHGTGLSGFYKPDGDLECGNSGTTMRTMAGLIAGRPMQVRLVGDIYLSRRPMERVAAPLRLMGAELETTDGHAPIVVRGGRLTGIEYELPVASALVKTAILLAGLQADGETSVLEPAPTRDHTERLLEFLGVPISSSANRLVIKSTQIQNAESLKIPGDMSSAAFLLAAAAIRPGSEVRIPDCGTNPTRAGFLEILRQFGADVRLEDETMVAGEPRGTIVVRAGDRRPLRLGAGDVPDTVDEIPLVALLGAIAEGETVVTGAEELRHKESDRIASICAGLKAMGADITPLPDGFTVRGGRPLSGTDVDSAGDHRIAMTLAVAGLTASGATTIEGWDAVAVSYPGFEDALASVTVPVAGG